MVNELVEAILLPEGIFVTNVKNHDLYVADTYKNVP